MSDAPPPGGALAPPRTGLLAGKRVLITGGSRGLGRAMARTFAEQGASHVAITCTTDAVEAAVDVRRAGAEVEAFRVPSHDAEATAQMVSRLEKAWGGIDVLVNNAGVSHTLPFALIDEADFDQVMTVNVKGVFVTTKAVLRGMIRRKSGVILNIGSIVGLRALDAPVHYAASKAAVHGFTLALSKEVARHHIRVLCLAPGLLEEGLGKNIPEHRLADFLRHCALGRAGTLDEVARFAAFLASERSSYTSGSIVAMDGGL